MNKLKFSSANAKLRSLYKVKELKKYLSGNRKVYSFDLLSGFTCPYAKDCQSFAVESKENNTRKIVDGKHTIFRCFSASQEVIFKNTYILRKHNTQTILPLAAENQGKATDLILQSIPENAGIVRLHVGGDFKTLAYFYAWFDVAQHKPNTLFYAYTKSLPFAAPFFQGKPNAIPNFILTASRGGYRDNLIDSEKLREAVVVFSEEEAKDKKLPIDHDDSHAATIGGSFALLIHGIQPKGSEAAKALRKLNGKGSYTRKEKATVD